MSDAQSNPLTKRVADRSPPPPRASAQRVPNGPGTPASVGSPRQVPGAPSTRPELLAPAGDWDCARAAVENGADAIYFGLEKFNARMRARNFITADLPELMEFLHRRGVKGYVTLNTLVFENEMADAEQTLRAVIAAGADAAIVQDVGVCRLIRSLSPDFPIHASTQMTVTSAGGVEFARDVGCNLVVLARECSIKEIEKISRAGETSENVNGISACRVGNPASLPLEVFIHGALCVAYSGQCLTSEALGGRSANRGECAQACRMPYEMISDGKPVPLGDRKYLLSPQDLAGLEVLPDLVRAGVTSLKIEGRLKSPEYVANITRIYRTALDQLAALTPARAPSQPDASRYEMEMAFSRGLYTGWLGGINNQALVHGRFGKKRGVYLGAVTQIAGGRVRLKLESPVRPGDGVVFDAGHPEQTEEGGRVYEVERRGNETWLSFGRGDVAFDRVHAGDRIWKTSDPELDRRLRQSFFGAAPKFQRPIEIEVHGLAGRPLTVVVRDDLGNVVRRDSAVTLAASEKQPLTEERLRAQLGRLGGTPFRLGSLRNFLEGDVLLPLSELNRLRRETVAALEVLRAKPRRWTLLDGGKDAALPCTRFGGDGGEGLRAEEKTAPARHSALNDGLPSQTLRRASGRRSAPSPPEAELIVLVRSLSQLDTALECGVRTLYCELEDPKKYRDAVRRFRESSHRAPGAALFVAPPRIFKMGEEWTLNQVRSSEADGYLVRNYDHLKFFAEDRRVGDFPLNIANRPAADYFKNRFGLERLTASYDLNFAQLEALLQAAPPAWFEVTIHQHMPMFHMEHCVFCAFLSQGTDYTNCGRPCDHHDVQLRDRVGAQHPVKADAGCRNTVYNARAQTGADYVARMLALGARHFRIEFVNEPPEHVARTITRYRQLLRGEITGPQLWRELKLLNQLGVTRGQIGGAEGA